MKWQFFSVRGFFLLTVVVHFALQTWAASLAWNANTEPDLAGYRVYYGETNTSPIKVDVQKQTSYALTNLSAGKTYFFYVTAYNTAALESNPSQTITYSVPQNNPPPPKLIANWGSSTISQVGGYNFYFGPVNGPAQKIDTGQAQTITLTNLSVGTNYAFHVAAYNPSRVEEQVYPEVQYTMKSGTNTITLAPPTAVVSSMFIGRDTLTQGSWKATYGATGFSLAGDATQLPPNCTMSSLPNQTWVWATNATDAAALERAGSTNRFAAAWYSTNRLDLNINFTDPYVHRVSLYFVDYDSQNRQQRVDLTDAVSGQVLDSLTISNFQAGVYLTWNVSGNVTFRSTPLASGFAVLSAALISSPAAGPNQPPTISQIADQTISYNSSTGPLAFNLSDPETAAGRLAVTASSSNTSLVPNANIQLSGNTGSRQVTITPAANMTGTALITLNVTDGDKVVQSSFGLTVLGNQPPTISAIADQSFPEDTSIVIPFNVADRESAASSLTITATSSNTSLISNNSVVLGGSGTNRTVKLTPASNKSGSATITIKVSDGTSTVTDAFVAQVTPVDDPPTMTFIRDRSIPPSSSTGPVSFTVADIDNSVSTLTVTASSSNTSLVPDEGIVLGGSGANRNLTINPTPDQTGTAEITVFLSDGTLTTTQTFTVNVRLDAPTYLVNEGFEPKGYENAGWYEIGTPNEDYTSTVLSDTKSLRSSNGQQIYRLLNSSTNLYLYTQLRWTSWRTDHTVIDLADATGNAAGFLWASASLDTLSIYHGQASARGTTKLKTGVTYNIWIDWTAAPLGTGGTMSLYISNTPDRPLLPEASLATGTGGPLSRVYFGAPSNGPVVLFDNICLSDKAAIGSNPAY